MPHFTTSDGLSLYFEDNGSGQPLICLAGLTRNCRDFDPMLPHLDNTRVIALDYRGRGKSDYDPNFRNYNIIREGQDVIELMDHLGLERATFLGTSRGGLISMMLAMGQADRMAGVILNDVGPVLDAGGLAVIMTYIGKPPPYKTYAEAAAGLAAFMAEDFPNVPLATWERAAKAQYVETPDGLGLAYDPHLRDALEAQSADGPLPDLWPMFDALKPLPTGVIHGATSNLLTVETLAEMQTRHPDMIARTVPDRGHIPFLDEAEAIEVINAILKTAR